MGIEFVQVEAKDQVVLEEWLAECKREWRPDMNLIVNDHEAMRSGIRSLLTRESVGICGEAEMQASI